MDPTPVYAVCNFMRLASAHPPVGNTQQSMSNENAGKEHSDKDMHALACKHICLLDEQEKEQQALVFRPRVFKSSSLSSLPFNLHHLFLPMHYRSSFLPASDAKQRIENIKQLLVFTFERLNLSLECFKLGSNADQYQMMCATEDWYTCVWSHNHLQRTLA